MHGLLRRVDLMHIWVFLKQIRNLLISKLPDLTAHGNRHRGHGILTLHGGQGKKLPLFKTVIKALAFCGKEIKTVLIAVHHVNGRGHGKSLIIDCRHNSPVDHITDIMQIILCFHLFTPPLLPVLFQAPVQVSVRC